MIFFTLFFLSSRKRRESLTANQNYQADYIVHTLESQTEKCVENATNAIQQYQGASTAPVTFREQPKLINASDVVCERFADKCDSNTSACNYKDNQVHCDCKTGFARTGPYVCIGEYG